MAITVGVLALQGAFVEHQERLERAAATIAAPIAIVQVRTPQELASCDALVMPGGESTTLARVAARSGLLEPLRAFVADGKPVWGTCAGLILLAEEVESGERKGEGQGGQGEQGGQGGHGSGTAPIIGGLNVRVHRNHYGRQINSFQADVALSFLGSDAPPFPAVFIRAPVVSAVGVHGSSSATPRAPVQVLGRVGPDIVAVQQGHVFGTSFHPELTGDVRVHAWWLQEVVRLVGEKGRAE